MDELERFKSAINLTEYAATRGYQLDRRESSRNSVVMRHPASNDKIIIACADRDRHWIYFSVRDDDDHGTILDFVCRRDRSSFPEACRTLATWLGDVRPRISPELYRPFVEPRRIDRRAARAEYERAHTVSNSLYLNCRGIRPEVIRHPRFVTTLREDSRHKVLFPHRDGLGFAGFESRYHDWTSFSLGGVKALWCSNSFPADTRLVLVESGIDALSHFQLYRDERTRYGSTGGTCSPHQLDVLRATFRTLAPGTTVCLAFDRDAGGELLANQVRELGGATFDRIRTPVGKDWNEVLEQREREFIGVSRRTARLCRAR
jgi:hypothetical protein